MYVRKLKRHKFLMPPLRIKPVTFMSLEGGSDSYELSGRPIVSYIIDGSREDVDRLQ